MKSLGSSEGKKKLEIITKYARWYPQTMFTFCVSRHTHTQIETEMFEMMNLVAQFMLYFLARSTVRLSFCAGRALFYFHRM